MPLEIYKASAGSGKTFQIVREYLKMVFKRPMAYKNILAVTFTNRATAEMKDRILTELYKISSGKKSAHLNYLTAKFSKPEAEIRQTAGKILKLILHDYSRFSISTIDTLFQRLIRSFSREMHLNPTFRTEIDSQDILEEAVNLLFLEIDNNEDLRRWMLDYMDDNLRDGKNWDLNGNLMERGAELFKEEFKQFTEPLLQKLADKNYLTNYSHKLKDIAGQYEKKMKEIGRQGLKLIEDHDLSIDQFKYGTSSFAKHFEKLAAGNLEAPKKRALDACDCCDSWYKSSDSPSVKAKIQSVYSGGLNDLLVTSISLMNSEGILAGTAEVILANLFSFGLLTDIGQKVLEVSRERNVILLNESTNLLQKVITGNDSPFVYEKLGSVYRHFMLDEFQDTSSLQWLNLKPLLENSLSEGHKSIVVGDVKQSIYRWRNGDWNLLASQLKKNFMQFDVKDTSLDTNWRSSKNIIAFNNIIFRESARQLNADFESALTGAGKSPGEMKGIIEKVYAEHYQQFSEKVYRDGYVKIKFIDGEKNQKKSSFRESAVTELISQIEIVLQKGVSPGDIAVLVRSKSEGAMIAKALLDRNYDILSNDSLLIGQSPVVGFILNIFSLFARPKNEIVKADLLYSYYKILLPKIDREEIDTSNYHEVFAFQNSVPELFKPWFDEEGILGNELNGLPLYNLATKIVEYFKLDRIKGELIYLGAFLDLIIQYGREKSAGISGFLDWWELAGTDKNISLSENHDAITILTIHKAKGLEFDTVFIPFCDWEIVPQGNKVPYLWCKPDQEPFDLLDIVLVKYGKHLERTFFADDYYKEMLYSIVDNLNLLYVAFTRAKHSLIINCPYADCKNSPGNVGALLQKIIENPPLLDSSDRDRYMNVSSFFNIETREFEIGQIEKTVPVVRDGQKTEISSFRLRGAENRLKLRLHSQDYFELGGNEISARINYGRLLHEIFENISTVKDVEITLKRLVSEGKIDAPTAGQYQKIIIDMLSCEPVKSWFDGSLSILNERNILRGSESRHRPDRVMISGKEVIVVDYKTGEKMDRHVYQIKQYLKDFYEMGFDKYKGYLWYLNDNEVIKVL